MELFSHLAGPPCRLGLFLVSYDGLNPDGTPDNALPHALPGLVVIGGACMILGFVYFLLLGLLQRKRPGPLLRLALGASLAASIPLPVLLYLIAVAVPDPMPGGWWAVTGLFALCFLSLMAGAGCSTRGYGLTIHSSRSRFAAVMWQVGSTFNWWLTHQGVEGRGEALEGIAILLGFGSPCFGLYGLSQLSTTKLPHSLRALGRAIPVIAALEAVVVVILPSWIST